jgi:hypothetical protein
MSNPFESADITLNGAVRDIVPVTPSDSTDNLGSSASGDKNVAIGLYIQTGGTLVINTYNNVTRTVTVPDGFTLVCAVRRVLSTGTTATGIHALVA